MLFGIVGQMDLGMRQVVRIGDLSTGGRKFGGKFRAPHCNQWGVWCCLFLNYFGESCYCRVVVQLSSTRREFSVRCLVLPSELWRYNTTSTFWPLTRLTSSWPRATLAGSARGGPASCSSAVYSSSCRCRSSGFRGCSSASCGSWHEMTPHGWSWWSSRTRNASRRSMGRAMMQGLPQQHMGKTCEVCLFVSALSYTLKIVWKHVQPIKNMFLLGFLVAFKSLIIFVFVGLL